MKKRQPVIDMSWQDFGHDLIITQDLDPIYTIAAASSMPDDILKRWLLAYWCYYHAGAASYVAEGKSSQFYARMWEGSGLDGDEKWPRGMERRYFYGQQAANLLNGLEDFGGPEKVVDAMVGHQDFQSIAVAVEEFTGFGPWMAWKIADMAERVLYYDVDFSDTSLAIYKDPVMGAAFILTGDKNYAISGEELASVVADMESQLSHLNAPPYYDRPVNIQEIETVLCKYKAHCYGFYPLGNDTHHIHKGFEKRNWGDLAGELHKHLYQYASHMEKYNGRNQTAVA